LEKQLVIPLAQQRVFFYLAAILTSERRLNVEEA
jgi:hypothetical protein